MHLGLTLEGCIGHNVPQEAMYAEQFTNKMEEYWSLLKEMGGGEQRLSAYRQPDVHAEIGKT